MNEENINNYIQKLPKQIQVFINSGLWEEKVSEISKKYSLSSDQIESLLDLVILVLTLVIEPPKLKDLIIEDLSVSDLLAEQIVVDLENRVFDYALKQIEKESEVSVSKNEKLMSSGTQLELRPENLPAIEENEPLRVNPAPTQPQKPVFQNDVLDKQIPIGVPRYAETPTTPPVTNPIIEKKLGGVGNNTAPIKYEKDPYREPLN